MVKKVAGFVGLLIVGGVFYQNCAKVSFDTSSPSLGAAAAPLCPGPTVICTVTNGAGTQTCTDTSSGPVYGQCVVDHCDPGFFLSGNMCLASSFAMVVTGGGLSAPMSSFTATVGQTYDFKISGSSDETTAGLNNAQSYLKKVSGQCSGNSIYQPFTVDLTQAGVMFQFGDNNFAYSSTVANSLGGCVWQVCASSALGTQACVTMTANANVVTTTTTTPTTLPTPTTVVTPTTIVTVTTMAPTTTVPPTTTTMKAPPPTTLPPTTTTSTTQPAACFFGGKTIASGSSVTAYAASTVPYGQSCQSQTRTCTNGNLSGTYTASSCTVQPPAACQFNGQSIASGSSVTAYQTASVGYGHTCVSQARTCTNGSLSGSYTYSSCTVNSKPDCPPSKVILSYNCSDNNGCGEWKNISTKETSPEEMKLAPQSAIYYRTANEKQFFQKVMLFGGQCPGTVSAGATGDVVNITLKPFQYGGGGDAQVKCQNGAWVVQSGDCDGNYGLCTYPKEGNVMVCTPSVTPNST